MPIESSSNFEKNVFINCPFDDEYFSLLRPLLFTVVFLGFSPKIASERSDSGEARLNKICEFINDSKYSIHDISRIKSSDKDELFRMNMPFELGIEYGCRHFSSSHLKEKRCLVLETEKYRFIEALSDLSGSDIKSHNDEPAAIVAAVRNWFIETVGLRNVKSPTVIWYQFNDFMADFYTKRESEGFTDEDLNMMPVPEFIDFIREWCGAD